VLLGANAYADKGKFITVDSIRKYWYMLFLVSVLVACVLSWIVPSWEGNITHLIVLAFTALIAWKLFTQLDRIEGKLDAILKKLSKD
jgi:hypothetical protein